MFPAVAPEQGPLPPPLATSVHLDGDANSAPHRCPLPCHALTETSSSLKSRENNRDN